MGLAWSLVWTLYKKACLGAHFWYQSPRYGRNLSKQEREARSIRSFTWAWKGVPPNATVWESGCGKAQRMHVRANAKLQAMKTTSASQRLKPREGVQTQSLHKTTACLRVHTNAYARCQRHGLSGTGGAARAAGAMPRRFPSPPNEADSSQDAPEGARRHQEAPRPEEAPGGPREP